MKFKSLAFALLVSSFAVAQATPPAASPAPSRPAASTPQQPTSAKPAQAAQPKELAPDAAVITIYDLCKSKLANLNDCKTVVTRSQFDELLRTMGQEQLPQDKKRQLATRYAQILIMATEAEKQGLESKPELQELFRLAKLQALAQAMQETLQEKAKPTPAEIQKFYDDNRQRLTQVNLERLMLPIKPKGSTATDDTAAMKKLLEELRPRALAGTDFKTLQAEAYQKAGLQNPPETKLMVLPETLPAAQRTVLELKPGEVSQVVQEPTGVYLFKMVGQEPIPLEKVKDEITKVVTQQKVQQAATAVLNSAKPNLNPDYFGPATETAPLK